MTDDETALMLLAFIAGMLSGVALLGVLAWGM